MECLCYVYLTGLGGGGEGLTTGCMSACLCVWWWSETNGVPLVLLRVLHLDEQWFEVSRSSREGSDMPTDLTAAAVRGSKQQ